MDLTSWVQVDVAGKYETYKGAQTVAILTRVFPCEYIYKYIYIYGAIIRLRPFTRLLLKLPPTIVISYEHYEDLQSAPKQCNQLSCQWSMPLLQFRIPPRFVKKKWRSEELIGQAHLWSNSPWTPARITTDATCKGPTARASRDVPACCCGPCRSWFILTRALRVGLHLADPAKNWPLLRVDFRPSNCFISRVASAKEGFRSFGSSTSCATIEGTGGGVS